MTDPTRPQADAGRSTLREDGRATVDASAENEGSPLRTNQAFWNDTFAQRYERVGLLGVGGIGEVRLLLDGRIGREIAQKTLREESRGSRLSVERFVREARVQGQLEHPAVVPVYDLGIDPDGHVYFTMKRVVGVSLDQVLAGERNDAAGSSTGGIYTRRKLLSAFVQVCLAMEYAHSRGVLHRDIKPANIMLGDFGEVHVLDWGIARVIKLGEPTGFDVPVVDTSDADHTPTLVGSVLGTPGYLSPEQARGETDSLDARTDVYSLGSVLFEILYRERLYTGTPAARISATLRGIPSFADRAYADDVPPELEAVCRKACALSESDRYPSARALAQAVESFLDGERDEQKRRELSLKHVAAARALEARAGTGDLAARREALRELGRALALDPSQSSALEELQRLLTDPPREVPRELQEEMEATTVDQKIAVLRGAVLRHAVWAGVALVSLVLLPLRNGQLAVFIAIALSALTALSIYVWRRAPTSRVGLMAVMAGSAAALGMLSVVFGPLVVLPSLAASNTVLFAPQTTRSERTILHGLLIAALVLPVLLGETGLVPRTYAFTEDGALALMSPLVMASGRTMLWLVTLIHVSAIVVPGKLSGSFFDRLREVETQLFVRSWYLRQLLPQKEAAVSPVSGGPPSRAR